MTISKKIKEDMLHPKSKSKPTASGKRIGKSRPLKANNQLNRRVK